MTLTAFLPCRAGSQRVANKNTRAFAGEPDGLLGIKLRQLAACPSISHIVLSTNDKAVIEIGERHATKCAKPLSIDVRPEHLCASTTSTDEVIAYVPTIIAEGDVLWTHVTSPFFDTREYERSVSAYRTALAAGTHDSLMGVLELQTFVWDTEGSLNYDRNVEKWPRTQTLKPVFEINSSVFIADIGIYQKQKDRIGRTPLLFCVSKEHNFDIDWEDDFRIAEEIWRIRSLSAP